MSTRRKKKKSSKPGKKAKTTAKKSAAKKSAAKKRAKKSSAKKKGGTRKQRRAATPPTSATGPEEGLETLEAPSPVSDAIAAALVEVKFEKQAGSPKLVRVERKGSPDVIPEGGDKGSVPGQRVGSTLVVWVHVTGSPGQEAKIKVTGAVESLITVKLQNTGQTAEPRNLLVTG
jgi:hypothetical protein